MARTLEILFCGLLALPWVMLLALAIADEVMFRRRFRK